MSSLPPPAGKATAPTNRKASNQAEEPSLSAGDNAIAKPLDAEECPVCGSMIAVNDLEAHVQAELAELDAAVEAK
eukprot:scaffold625101_cov28-Prasinocladus_malaysianus.AAC.1